MRMVFQNDELTVKFDEENHELAVSVKARPVCCLRIKVENNRLVVIAGDRDSSLFTPASPVIVRGNHFDE